MGDETLNFSMQIIKPNGDDADKMLASLNIELAPQHAWEIFRDALDQATKPTGVLLAGETERSRR